MPLLGCRTWGRDRGVTAVLRPTDGGAVVLRPVGIGPVACCGFATVGEGVVGGGSTTRGSPVLAVVARVADGRAPPPCPARRIATIPTAAAALGIAERAILSRGESGRRGEVAVGAWRPTMSVGGDHVMELKPIGHYDRDLVADMDRSR
jgi:hypothetical protein